MAERKNGLGCPVCDGVEMQMLRPSEELELALDYCDVCGGMWFESGEVRQLRVLRPEILTSLITMKKQLHTVDCPSCTRPMTRNVSECSACGHENTLNCPVCGTGLERVRSDRFTVDVCRACRGVWFDNIDLSEVWKLQFDNSAQSGEAELRLTSEGGGGGGGGDGGDTTDTVVAILRHRRDAGTEAAGDQSRNVFGTIADIVGGIFSASD